MDDEWEESSRRFLDSSRFWIQKVLVPMMVCMGIGGNIVTVMVLTRRRMRCSTNVYLTALAVTDIVFLLFVFVLSFCHYDNIHDRKYELYWRFFGLTHWLCDAASGTSIWLTVSFTLERYIAVCHPIKGKVLCTESRAKSIIVIVTILCILTTASTTFEYELALEESCNRNCTVEELKRMQQVTGKSLQNVTIHYLHNHTIVVTNLQNSDPSNVQIANEVYTNLQPRLSSLLPSNCSHHPHIIYVPIYSQKLNDNLIENEANSDSAAAAAAAASKEISAREVRALIDPVGRDSLENMTSWTGKLDEMYGDNSTLTDECCDKNYTIGAGRTKLGENETYKAVIYWYTVMFFWLLPLVSIATFNCFLIRAVYQSQRRRKRMTNSQENVPMSNENRITVMLIGVVFLFLICQTPTATFLIYESYSTARDPVTENIKLALGNIFNFLLTVNAACNFLLYCVLSKKYRDTFKSLFFDTKKVRQDTILLSSRSSRNSSRFNTNGFRRNVSEYHTPRNLETQSLTSIPRSKSLMVRQPGKAKSTDLVV